MIIKSTRSTKPTFAFAWLAVLVALAGTPASAQGHYHPRRGEVMGRDRNMNQELYSDRGQLGGNFGQLEHKDQKIRWQEQRDARMNGGYITPQEQAHFNREENHLQNQINRDYRGQGYAPGANPMGMAPGMGLPMAIGGAPGMIPGQGPVPAPAFNNGYGYGNGYRNGNFAANHPRRAQVLGADRGLNQEINQDRGNLNGHYGQLESEDQRIRAQEQSDAYKNGGYITPQERAHLDRKEAKLQNQINRDY